MINNDIMEANERGLVRPEEVMAFFGAMMENFLKKLPDENRQTFWDVFKIIMARKVGLK